MNNKEKRSEKPRVKRSFSKEERNDGAKKFDDSSKKIRKSFNSDAEISKDSFKPKSSSSSVKKKYPSDKPKRSYDRDSHNSDRPKRSYNRDENSSDRPRRSYNRDENSSDRPKRSYNRDENSSDRPRRSYNRDENSSDRPRRSYNRDENSSDRPRRSYNRDENGSDRPRRSYDRNKNFESEEPRRKRRDVTAESEILTEIVERRKREGRQTPRRQKINSLEYEEKYGPIRLNKYIANAGICSRRDADTLIETGAITVNGAIVTELGTKVMPTDEIRYGDKILQREKPVYLLLNKPKDYITTTDDERDRKHVIQLVKGACKERIYPVGRLDKNTTGVLLFTNDGEMTKKLTHPKHGIRKIYHVELDKNLTFEDFNKIMEGVELDDGIIIPDEMAYVGNSKREIGITIHSGRNRVVRRIFESLNYQVIKLDRVVFAGLTKKDLPRGKWRFLSREEINILKMSL